MLAIAIALADGPSEPNRLTVGSGAVVVRASSGAEALAAAAIDGDARTVAVGLPKREPLPLSVVIELPAPTTFTRFAFPPFDEYGPAAGRHVRTVRVEGSSTSADAGFAPLVEAVLAEGRKDAQVFAVDAPAPVRWVRVTAVDRHRPPTADWEPHHFTEIEGYGPQAPIGAAEFDGRWRYRRKGLNDAPGTNVIELVQDGDSVRGCEIVGGQPRTIGGHVEGGLARLTREDDQGRRKAFTAVLTAEGELSGVTFDGPTRSFWAAPDAAATSPCPSHPKVDPVASAIAAGQQVVLYGIRFDVDSDVLRPDATPALEQLLAALKGAPTRSVTVQGHTDSDASDAHNLDLSTRRAKSVAAWLVARGVEAGRLAPVGKGEAEPIADNASSAGRALNRRVEIEPR